MKERQEAVQGLEEKLAVPVAGDGIARCKLKHLKKRWGVEVTEWLKAELICVNGMDDVEIWSKHSGTGDEAEFQLIERRKS